MKVILNKKALLKYILITIGGFSFASCHSNEQSKNVEQSAPTAIADEETTSLSEYSDNDVVFKDKNGEIVSVRSLKGKVVFINFWATWCPPCIHEMPSINELKKAFKDKDIVFLMVDVDNKIEKSVEFMDKKNYDLPVYVPAGNIPSDYLGGAIPTTVILDKKGKMVARIEGGRDYANPEIVKAIKELAESN